MTLERDEPVMIRVFTPRMTRALCAAIAVYFAMTWIAGGPDDLAVIVSFGGNIGPLVATGDLWRLVVSIFMHGSLLHLLVNGYALYVLGRNLEAFYGPWAFLFLFLFSGLGGSIASATLSQAISVGASGGIFGLLGASIVFAFKYRGVLPPRVTKVMGTMLLPWVALNLILGSVVPVIDGNAHVGGLVTGALLALFVPSAALDAAFLRQRPQFTRMVASLCISLLLVSFASAGQNIFRTRDAQGPMLDARAILGLGEINLRQAIEAASAILAENPRNNAIRMARAQLLFRTGEWLRVIQDFQSVIAEDPDHREALNGLAWVLLEEAPEELRSLREAERLATRAVKISPNDPYVLGTYGTVLLRRGDPLGAADYLRKALETKRHPLEEATDHYLLAIALARAGLTEEAREFLELGVHSDPRSSYRSEAEAATGVVTQRAPSL